MWAHVLGLVDTATHDWRLPGAPVVVDQDCTPDAGPLVQGLLARRRTFMVEIAATDEPEVLAGREATASPTHPVRTATARRTAKVEHLSRAGSGTLWRTGSSIRSGSALLHEGFVYPVRFADAGPCDPTPPLRLLRSTCVEGTGSERYWVTGLPRHEVAETLETALRGVPANRSPSSNQAGAEYGLREFEGRSYPGWHHHMTLVSAAYVYDLVHGVHQSLLPPSADRQDPRPRALESVSGTAPVQVVPDTPLLSSAGPPAGPPLARITSTAAWVSASARAVRPPARHTSATSVSGASGSGM